MGRNSKTIHSLGDRHQGGAGAQLQGAPLTNLLQLERRVTRKLLEADTCAQGIEDIIRVICEWQNWSGGTFWRADQPSGILTEVLCWSRAEHAWPPGPPTPATAPPWLHDRPVWISQLSADELRTQGSDAWTPPCPGAVVPIRSGQHLCSIMTFDADGQEAAAASEVMDTLGALASTILLFCERAAATQRLRDSEQRYASTLALAAIGIAHVDLSGLFLYGNPRLCQMLGYTEGELTQRTVKQISHPEDVGVTHEVAGKLRRGEIDFFKVEKRYLRKDGDPIWVALTVAQRRDGAGHSMYDVSIFEDITARKLAQERVQYLATHDALTGLPNRVMFSQLLAFAIQSARRRNSKIAILFIDLDRFKMINDSLGHDAGDILLCEMASRFRECLRASDAVARLGGDEFVALLQGVCDEADVRIVAQRFLAAAMRPVKIHHQEWRVTASIGICLHPEVDQDDQAAMKNADLALYVAKEEGKNTCHFYSPSLRARAAGRVAIETHLRCAIERAELCLHYQAKVHIETDIITGVEALLRWHSPELGVVSPLHFIPVAEESGLIIPIGQWVLHEACAQGARWLHAGLPSIRICVNLSIRQLDDTGLIDDIRTALASSGIPPHMLELEITESMVMHNTERALAVLTQIKALGVRLAIDDFGTGYSSLAQLKRFPIDTLKVDRSFIREIPRSPEDRAITEAIITMAKTLSLTIVAEGVETPEQKAFLRGRACDEMQGFYFSTPLPADEFALLLGKSTAPQK